MSCPCQHCSDRVVGCHGGCPKYKDYRAGIDARNAIRKRQAAEEQFFASICIKRAERTEKAMRSRR